MSSDEIVKTVLLKAPLDRVWRAITDSKEFGTWFGMRLDGPFTTGQPIKGVIACTAVDEEVARMQKPFEGTPVHFFVEKIQPQSLFAIRWHPYAIDPKVDYSKEPMTLITFELDQKGDNVLLTITESGFDKIPLHRRVQAFKANDGGWQKQTEMIRKYLEH
jgi:uncharacterized protein YndB with AHSA1/START domain